MIVKIKDEYDVESYREFMLNLGIEIDESSDNYWDNGTDEELITEQLSKLDGNYIVTFIDGNDGYFRIFEI